MKPQLLAFSERGKSRQIVDGTRIYCACRANDNKRRQALAPIDALEIIGTASSRSSRFSSSVVSQRLRNRL
jgi:hypothetical protein